MNNKKTKFLLYQTNSLKRLEEIKLKDQRKKEKYIEDFFVNNLENIFSDLVLAIALIGLLLRLFIIKRFKNNKKNQVATQN